MRCVCRGYLESAAAALEAEAGDGGFVRGGDSGGGAGVPQVVVEDLPLRGAHHQPRAVRREVYRREGAVHPDGPQHAAGTRRI